MPAATADSALDVTFAGTGACAGGATITMNHVGTCTVTARQPGNAFWNPAQPETQSFTVSKGVQTISFTSTVPTNAKVGDTYRPTATGGGSPLPVTFAVSGGNCSYNSSTGLVTFDQAGRCTVSADQAGNADYEAAPQVKQFGGSVKKGQAITFSSSAPVTALVGDSYTPLATSNSGLPVSLGTTGGNCSYHSGTGAVTMDQAGACTITADQAGSAAYVPAVQKSQTITILVLARAPSSFHATGGVRSIALTWGPPADTGGLPVTSYLLTATAGSTVITKSLTPGSVCTTACAFGLTGLPNATSYTLALSARTQAGAGPAANASAATFGLPSAAAEPQRRRR